MPNWGAPYDGMWEGVYPVLTLSSWFCDVNVSFIIHSCARNTMTWNTHMLLVCVCSVHVFIHTRSFHSSSSLPSIHCLTVLMLSCVLGSSVPLQSERETDRQICVLRHLWSVLDFVHVCSAAQDRLNFHKWLQKKLYEIRTKMSFNEAACVECQFKLESTLLWVNKA